MGRYTSSAHARSGAKNDILIFPKEESRRIVGVREMFHESTAVVPLLARECELTWHESSFVAVLLLVAGLHTSTHDFKNSSCSSEFDNVFLILSSLTILDRSLRSS